MKKWLFFLGGVVMGFILAIVLGVIINRCQDSPAQPQTELKGQTEEKEDKIDGLTLFETPGKAFEERSMKVFQVLAQNAALVSGESNYGYRGQTYLLINQQNEYYYDEEIIKVPQGKVLRQIGVYQYVTRAEMSKTVPVVMIMD